MTSKEKLQNICNYIEKKSTLTPTFNMSVIEMVSDDDEYLLAEKKRQNRELAIDITLGEKDESEWVNKDMIWGETISDRLESINIISPKVITINLNISNLKTHDEVYDFVIDFIDKNTSNAKKLQNGGNSTQFNIKMGSGNYPPEYTDSEKLDVDIRRILTKVNLCSSVISIEGRMGPAKTILIGRNNWSYFKEIEFRHGGINSLNFVYEDKIDPNKVIVLRNNDSNHPGIFIVENNKTDFYIKETLKWDKQFCWFWIT